MATLVTILSITLYDSTLPGEVTVRVATHNLTTRPSETPANTTWLQRLIQPAAVKRWAFDAGTIGGRSLTGIGNAVIANGDGALDWMLECAVDGRVVEQRTGPIGGAYPADFPITFKGTAEQLTVPKRGQIEIKLRDMQAETETPLQTNKYLGDNTPPAGLEGLPGDLKGQPKPITLGRPDGDTGGNVSPKQVNAPKMIWQYHDGAASVDKVYDMGVELLDGARWVAQTAPASHFFECSAFGNGLFLAGGAGGALATSPDGATWTARTSGFGASSIIGIAYGAGIYVLVGAAGKIFTSANGTTGYTSQASGFGATTIWDVHYDATLGLFCAVGGSGKVSTSPDGITWTLQADAATEAGASTSLFSVTSDGNVLVAVGDTGTIISSPDGVDWTARTEDLDGDFFRDVDYGNGLFVAAGNFMATSPDGLTWTRRAAPSGVSFWHIIYGAQFVAAVDDNGTSGIASSADGLNWTVQARSVFGGAGVFPRSVAYGGGTYIGVTFAGLIASTDTTPYADAVDVEDDQLAPMAGEFLQCPTEGLFRLGSSPAGVVTCDPVEGATLADRTAGQCTVRVLERMGYTTGDWSASDITALDSARPYEVGDWIDSEIAGNAVIDRLMNSVGAWWGPDLPGVFRFRVFEAPSGTPVMSFTENDLIEPLTWSPPNDAHKGLPRYRTIKRYGRHYTVQASGLAGSVTDERRAHLAQEWRTATSEDLSVLTAHLLAQQASSDTLLVHEADAQDEADREQALLGVIRRRYRLVVQLTAARDALDLFPVISLTHPKYGLSGGKLLRIIGLDPDRTRKRLVITGWG